MKRISTLVMVLILCLGIVTAYADNDFDPLERNLIFVEGDAEITVPVNGFSLTFSFDIEKDSFNAASSESTRIINEISSQVKQMNLNNVEVIKGWDILKQAKISFGSKGRKISNRLIVKVLDYPKGGLHELIATIIDKSIAVDKSVVLEDISVFISEGIENKKKEEVLAEALKALQSNANSAAKALGKNLIAPKRIFITNEQEVYTDVAPTYLMKSSTFSKKLISVQKSFKVDAEVVDHMKISANVAGIYQIE